MSAENEQIPFYKRWWFYVIIGVLVIGAIGNAGEESASEDDDEENENIRDENEEKVDAEAPEDEEENEEDELISDDPIKIAEEILGDDYKDGSLDDGGTSVRIDYGDPFFSGQRGFERDIENILEQYHHLDETPDSAFYLLDDDEEIVFSYEFSAEDIEDMDIDEGIDDIQSFAATYYEREDEDDDNEDDEDNDEEETESSWIEDQDVHELEKGEEHASLGRFSGIRAYSYAEYEESITVENEDEISDDEAIIGTFMAVQYEDSTGSNTLVYRSGSFSLFDEDGNEFEQVYSIPDEGQSEDDIPLPFPTQTLEESNGVMAGYLYFKIPEDQVGDDLYITFEEISDTINGEVNNETYTEKGDSFLILPGE